MKLCTIIKFPQECNKKVQPGCKLQHKKKKKKKMRERQFKHKHGAPPQWNVSQRHRPQRAGICCFLRIN